jgi:hypothetical protein
MTNFKIISLFVFNFYLANNSLASKFHIGVLPTYTLIHDKQNIYSGIFNIKNKRINIGFDFNLDLVTKKKYLYNLGIEIIPFTSNTVAVNQIKGFYIDFDPIQWTENFSILSTYFKISQKINKSKDWYLYLRPTFGYIFNTVTRIDLYNVKPIDPSNSDIIKQYVFANSNQKKLNEFFSIDFGTSYSPASLRNKIQFNFSISPQLNRMSKLEYNGTIENYSKLEKYNYILFTEKKIINFKLGISYKI